MLINLSGEQHGPFAERDGCVAAWRSPQRKLPPLSPAKVNLLLVG